MAYGNHRFLVNNLARTAYLASPSGVQASTIEPGRIGGVQKTGTGAAVWKAAGEFTGQQDLLIVEQIDAVGTGEVGSATFRWRTNLTTGDGNWEASGVATDTDYTALGSDGKQVAWEQGSGADFALYDSGVFECKALFGPGRLFDNDRDSFWKSGSLTTNLVTNPDFNDDVSSWTNVNCTIASVAGGQSGNCLEITRTGAAVQYVVQDITTVAEHAYIFKVYVKSGSSGNEAFFIGAWDTDVGEYMGRVDDTSSGDWVQHEFTFVANDTSTRIYLAKNTGTAGTMLFDTVECYEIPTLTIDLGSAVNITAIVIQDHNASASAAYTFYANSSNDWDSPAYTKALTETDDPIIEYIDQTYRYLRFEFRDETNSDGYVRVSLLYAGTYTELVDAQTPPETAITTKRNLIENTSEVGIRRQRIHTTQRTFPLVFKYIDETDTDSLQTIWEALFDVDTGEVDPLWLHYFYDENDTLIFCRCVSDFEKEFYRANIFNVLSLQFEEVPKSRV